MLNSGTAGVAEGSGDGDSLGVDEGLEVANSDGFEVSEMSKMTVQLYCEEIKPALSMY
jgi:hypothetical protein